MRESSEESPADQLAAAPFLPTLPDEVIEAVCQPLSVEDRVALLACCRNLYTRAHLAASTTLWTDLTLSDERHMQPGARLQALAAWLASHRPSLQHVRLQFSLLSGQEAVRALSLLLASLAGSPLTRLAVIAQSLYQARPSQDDWLPLQHMQLLTRLSFHGCSLAAIPAAVSALTSLADLDIACDDLAPADWRPLQHLGASLTRLGLRQCELEALPPSLSCLTGLKELDLELNEPLGQEDPVDDALQPLRHLAGLSRLSLSGCGLEIVPKQLTVLPALAELDLSYSFWGGARDGDLVALRHPALAAGLRQLDCRDCDLAFVPLAFTALTALQGLIISGNKVYKGQQALGDGTNTPLYEPLQHISHLQHLRGLTRLEASNCALKSLPSELAALSALAVLHLSDNPGLTAGVLQLLAQLPALCELQLAGCELPTRCAELDALSAKGVRLVFQVAPASQ